MSKIRTIEYVRGMKEINETFEIIDNKGQGTFASVFTVKSKLDLSSDVYAMKMIVPTVELRRVENEIRALRELGGKHGVIKMLSAMRIRDHIFILMPFVDYIAFSNYFLSFNEKEIRRYLLHLLRALEHVHKLGIIHRDVKPTNFLLDRNSRRYTLVDFGLAHSQNHGDLDASWDPLTNPTQTVNKPNFPGFKRTRSLAHFENLPSPAKNIRMLERTTPVMFNPCQSIEKSMPKPTAYPRLSTSCLSSTSGAGNNGGFQPLASSSIEEQCGCGNRLAICRACRSFPKSQAARRGGTLGFRPPEVMLRCINQTTKIDLWAVGVIFLSFLTGRYPFVKVDDDLEVLHAFTHLIGYERMQRGAYSVGKRLLIDPRPPPLGENETQLTYMKRRLIGIRRAERRLVAPPPSLKDSCSGKPAPATSSPIALANTHHFPTAAYDLAMKLLEPSPSLRISAADATRHPYIKGKTVPQPPKAANK